MRSNHHRSALVFIVGLAVAVAACAKAGPGRGFSRDLEKVACQGFNVIPRDIEVGPAGGGFDIPAGHRLEFTAGAVPVTTTYRVSAGPNADAPEYWAEIQIVPISGGMVTQFEGDVFLEINYAPCAPLSGDLGILMDPDTGDEKPIGGRVGGNRIRALIPHLTLFAIAR